MKKLMIALAAVAFAGIASAATFQWQSGTMYVPVKGGGNGTMNVAETAGNVLVNASIFHLTAEAYAAMKLGDDGVTPLSVADTQAKIYSQYKDGKLGAVYQTGDNINASTSKKVGAVNITEATTYGTGDSIYGIIIYEATTADGDFYIANMGSWTYGSDSSKSLTNMGAKWESTGSALAWTAVSVPEPTSGLLMLLGFAGLALRRRHA